MAFLQLGETVRLLEEFEIATLSSAHGIQSRALFCVKYHCIKPAGVTDMLTSAIESSDSKDLRNSLNNLWYRLCFKYSREHILSKSIKCFYASCQNIDI